MGCPWRRDSDNRKLIMPPITSPQTTDIDLTVVVMAYNEVGTLEAAVADILKAISNIGVIGEILIVDDGSTDGTSALTDKLSQEKRIVRVIHHPTNLCVGEVWWSGFANAQGRYLTFFPADGQFPSTIIEDFYPRMAHADMICGYIDGRNRPMIGKLLSKAERLIFTILFGRMPRFQGIIMFRRGLLNDLVLKSPRGLRGWVVQMELVIRAKRAGCSIESRLTTLLPRSQGYSKVNNIRNIYHNLIQAFGLWLAM